MNTRLSLSLSVHDLKKGRVRTSALNRENEIYIRTVSLCPLFGMLLILGVDHQNSDVLAGKLSSKFKMCPKEGGIFWHLGIVCSSYCTRYFFFKVLKNISGLCILIWLSGQFSHPVIPFFRAP